MTTAATAKTNISRMRLEVAVEDLYDTLSRNGLVDWKKKFSSHPLASVKQYESEKLHNQLDQVTIDLDLLRLQIESALEKKAKKKTGKLKPS